MENEQPKREIQYCRSKTNNSLGNNGITEEMLQSMDRTNDANQMKRIVDLPNTQKRGKGSMHKLQKNRTKRYDL